MKYAHHYSTGQTNKGHSAWMQIPELCLEDYMLQRGHKHQNHLLSVLNAPTLNNTAYKVCEHEVGCCMEAVAKESCINVICQEKQNSVSGIDGMTEMATSYDMEWQKRDERYN